MINEQRVFMKKIHKVAKNYKEWDLSLTYDLCLKLAFKEVNRRKTIKRAKMIDKILNRGIIGLTTGI